MNSQSNQKSNFGKWVIGIIALAVVALLVFVVSQNTQSKNNAEVSKNEATANLKLNIPKNASQFGSFAVDSAGKVIPPSEVDSSKTRVEFILDPHCGGCKVVETGLKDTLAELRTNGDIQIYYTPVSFMSSGSFDEYSARAVSSLVTVAEHDPEHFTAFLEKLYEKFPSPYPASGVSFEKIGEWAKEANVSEAAISRFSDQDFRMFATENVKTQESRLEIFENGQISTPKVLVGGTVSESGVLEDFITVPFRDSDVVKTFNETLALAKVQSK